MPITAGSYGETEQLRKNQRRMSQLQWPRGNIALHSNQMIPSNQEQDFSFNPHIRGTLPYSAAKDPWDGRERMSLSLVVLVHFFNSTSSKQMFLAIPLCELFHLAN